VISIPADTVGLKRVVALSTTVAWALGTGPALYPTIRTTNEYFDPVADGDANPATPSFTGAGGMFEPRLDHSATALADGRVVIAGGRTDWSINQYTSSIEIYDPITNTFALSNTALSAARTGHAAAQTYDGIVAIAGGFDGASVLASIDLYDPFSDTVTAGPALHVASPDGKLLGSIPAPVSLITAAFAGKDKKTVYAVTSLRSPDGMQRAEVYSIPMIAQGFGGRAK